MGLSGAFALRIPVRQAGSPIAGAVLDVRTIVCPASYAVGGIPVDLSASYSSIVAVLVTRWYVTATKAATKRFAEPQEIGADLYSSAKFRFIVIAASPSHTHTYDKANTPTGNENIASLAGAENNHTHPLTYTSTASGSTSTSVGGEISAGADLSTMTIEYLVIGVPL